MLQKPDILTCYRHCGFSATPRQKGLIGGHRWDFTQAWSAANRRNILFSLIDSAAHAKTSVTCDSSRVTIRFTATVKSILPKELESKRLIIARTHNLLCVYLLALVFGSPLLVIAVIRMMHASLQISGVALVVAVLVAGLIEAYGLRHIVHRDNELCRQLGYLCPCCHEPLYESRAATWANGLCPKCNKSIV